MGCALAFPKFLKYWNRILYTHNLALIKVKSDRMVIATVQWLFITNVTWQKFDLSAKYTVVGHRTIWNANKCPQHWWGEAASPCESLSISTDGHAWSCICVSTSKSKKTPFLWARSGPYLWFLGPHKSASRSVQQFLYGQQTRVADRQTDRPRYMFCDYACDAAEKRYYIVQTGREDFCPTMVEASLVNGIAQGSVCFSPYW